MNEKQINPQLVVISLENLIDRQYTESKKPLLEEMQRVASLGEANQDYAGLLSSQAENIIKHNWFKAGFTGSKKLKDFKEFYELLLKKKK